MTPRSSGPEHFLGAVIVLFVLALAFSFLYGCGHTPAPPPTSLACKLTDPPPVWYRIEGAGIPACVVVGVFIVPQGRCCPPDTVCLTPDGGRAALMNEQKFPPWTAEAWLRCREKR